MKKLLIAALIAGSLTLTACDDKEKTRSLSKPKSKRR